MAETLVPNLAYGDILALYPFRGWGKSIPTGICCHCCHEKGCVTNASGTEVGHGGEVAGKWNVREPKQDRDDILYPISQRNQSSDRTYVYLGMTHATSYSCTFGSKCHTYHRIFDGNGGGSVRGNS